MTYFKSVKLDIGVAMRETPDNTLNSLLGTIWIVAYFVTDLDNSTPILGGQVLVGSLDCDEVSRTNVEIVRRASAVVRSITRCYGK